MHRLLRRHINQIRNVFANRVLAIFVEGRRKPNCSAIRQRTKAGVEMIKARIDKLHRNHETTEHLRDSAVGFDVGSEFVTAKKHIAREKRVAFALEIVVVRQPRNLVAVFFHPAREMRRFAGAFFMPKIAWNKLFSYSQSGIGGKDHVRQFRLWRDQFDLTIEPGKRGLQTGPLILRERGFGAAGPTHPGINLVLDAVIIRRAQQKLAHKIDSYLSPS